MRFSSSIVRTLVRRSSLAAAAVILLGFASVAPADAAPSGLIRSCRQRASLTRWLTAKRPVIILSEAARAGVVNVGAVLHRSLRTLDDDDDQAVQDAPAARIDLDAARVPLLEPIGTLANRGAALPARRMLSRRSPRGPPVFR